MVHIVAILLSIVCLRLLFITDELKERIEELEDDVKTLTDKRYALYKKFFM